MAAQLPTNNIDEDGCGAHRNIPILFVEPNTVMIEAADEGFHEGEQLVVEIG